MMYTPSTKGFTLIELLVVIAIIGVLSSVVLASLSTARMKARDAARKADFHQMAVALELYYNDHGGYPATGTIGAVDGQHYANSSVDWNGGVVDWANLFTPLVTAGEMPDVPRDPINVPSGNYPWSPRPSVGMAVNRLYHYRSDGTPGGSDAKHYLLCTWLEDTSDPSILGVQDMQDPFNPPLMLHADDGYSFYNYCVGQ